MTDGQSDEAKWKREQALAFSRHYDSLHWIVTSLLTTSNAALLALGGSASIQVALLGVGLAIVTVIFASGFRQVRRRIHSRLDDDRWLWAGASGWTRQWPWYVAFFTGIAALWFWLLFSHFPADDWAWGGLALVAGVGFVQLYRTGL